MSTPNFEYLDWAIKQYACYLFVHYKNITIDDKSVAAVLKLVTPAYLADLNTVLSQDGLSLYIYHNLYKVLKADASFMPLTFWSTNGITP